MAYDPQRERRRPQPTGDDPAPVDALLGDAPSVSLNEDPPPPSVTPEPADPPPDTLLLGSGAAVAIAGLVFLLLLRHLWLRHRRAAEG